MQFDINEFYPSISEELLRNSIRFAKNYTTIEQEEEEEELIMACRKSILFNDGRVWTNKEKNFDVTMSAKDGIIYIEDANGPLLNRIEKALHRIFKGNKLSISLEQKGHEVNFLDVTIEVTFYYCEKYVRW